LAGTLPPFEGIRNLVEFSERRYRRPLALLLAFSLVSAPAAARCAREEEQQAFDITALKSELMVMGVSSECRQDAQYNAFVNRYRSQLVAADRAVTDWFKHSFGRAATSHQDAFITELANLRSRTAQSLGSDYCPRNKLIFAEVMALPTESDLGAFAAGKNLLPAEIRACEQAKTTPASTRPARPARTRSASR
jgi:hypothetical protein